jgi:hypothetical protein
MNFLVALRFFVLKLWVASKSYVKKVSGAADNEFKEEKLITIRATKISAKVKDRYVEVYCHP